MIYVRLVLELRRYSDLHEPQPAYSSGEDQNHERYINDPNDHAKEDVQG